MKKILLITLVLTMLLSFNAFALTSSEIIDGGVKVAGVDSGVEVVLSKNGSNLTATAYLVGELKNISGITVGLQFPDSALLAGNKASVAVVTADEFTAAAPTWSCTPKNVDYQQKNMAGCVASFSPLNPVLLNVDANARLKFVEITYTLAENIDITSENYDDYLEFLMRSPASTTIKLGSTTVQPNDATYFSLYSFDPSGLDSFNISVSPTTNGVATLSATKVAGGQSTDLTVIPAVGYYISSVMAGEANLASSFDAYRGGTIKYAPTADTAITVTFAEINNVTEDVTTSTGMTGVDALTLPEVFRGKVNNEDVKDVSVAFGQIAPNAGKTVAGYGIYLTKADGSDVTTAAPSIGPKFAAKSISPENQFGIIFEQIKPGSYNAQTYIEYTDGSIVLGIKVPFTVAE